MSLIDHIGLTEKQLAALFEDRRARITPTECDRGEHCYVRDGLSAYQKLRGPIYGICTGCRGKMRAF